MSVHFQVYADFTLTKGKPQLIKTSIFTTTAAVTSTVFSPNVGSNLTISRIFHTLSDAYGYISYLHAVYPNSIAPPPVLDSGQIDFFPEVSK